jgi:N6-adenosine-specific RNA methylase IME4
VTQENAFNIPETEGGWDFIMADPPWHFATFSAKGGGKSPQAHYKTMPLDVIKSLPVGDVAAKDCLLWLWATGANLPLALECLPAWGFKYSTLGYWGKLTKTGKIAFGTGYGFRCAGEPIILARKGKPKNERNVRSLIMGLGGPGSGRAHSEKPDEAYMAAESLMPNAKRLDLFSRKTRDGWTAFGDEAGKFDDAMQGGVIE